MLPALVLPGYYLFDDFPMLFRCGGVVNNFFNNHRRDVLRDPRMHAGFAAEDDRPRHRCVFLGEPDDDEAAVLRLRVRAVLAPAEPRDGGDEPVIRLQPFRPADVAFGGVRFKSH